MAYTGMMSTGAFGSTKNKKIDDLAMASQPTQLFSAVIGLEDSGNSLPVPAETEQPLTFVEIVWESESGVPDKCAIEPLSQVSALEKTSWYEDSDEIHIILSLNLDLTERLNSGDYGALAAAADGSFMIEKFSSTDLGPISKSPVTGDLKKTFSTSFSVPSKAGSYMCAHACSCTNLEMINQKIGTTFSTPIRMKSHFSEDLMSAGKVRSKKVKDYTKLSRLANIDTSLEPLDHSLIESSTPVKEFSATLSKTNAQIMFDIDVVDALRISPFGGIFFKSLPVRVKEEIISKAQISSMEVTRYRKDSEETPVTIGESYQEKASSLLKPRTQSFRDRNNLGGQKFGIISEMKIQSSNGIRTFGVEDISFPDSGGTYEYEVKFKMKDAVYFYLMEKLLKLRSSIIESRSWIQTHTTPTSADPIRDSFSYKASKDIQKAYQNKNTPIELAVALYAEIAGDIFGAMSSRDVASAALPLINCSTGSPSKVEEFIAIMEVLESKMINLLGLSSNIGITTSSSRGANPAGKRGDAGRTLEIKRKFCNQEVKASDLGAGYVFFEDNKGEFGTNIITRENYQNRCQRELAAFSDSEKASVPSDIADETNLSSAKVSALTDLTSTLTSYLTPSSVFLQGETLDISTPSRKWDSQNTIGIVESVRENKTKLVGPLGSLSALGITCVLFGRKAREKEGKGTFAVNSKESGGIFEDTDNFVSKNIDDSIQSWKKGPEEIFTDAIAAALSPSIVNGLHSSGPGTGLSIFDASNSDSVIEDISIREFREMPLQVACIFLSKSEDIKKNWFEDTDDSAALDISCNSIAQIEALTYIDEVPEWKVLTPAMFSRSSESSLRCRIVSYSDSKLGLGRKEDLKMPILNSQFLITGNSDIFSPRSTRKNSTPNKMRKYLLKQRTIVMDTMSDMTGIETKEKAVVARSQAIKKTTTLTASKNYYGKMD